MGYTCLIVGALFRILGINVRLVVSFLREGRCAGFRIFFACI